MIELFNLGISEEDIQEILQINPEIKDLNESEIHELILLLKKIGCNDREIKNIIITNPFYLSRTSTDIIELIQILTRIGLTNLSLIFDSNPYLLNKDAFEIKDYLKRKSQNYSLEEIIDYIDSNPYFLEEE